LHEAVKGGCGSSDSNRVMMLSFGKKGDEGGNSSMRNNSSDSFSECDQTKEV